MRTKPHEWTDRARSPNGLFKTECGNGHEMTDDNTYISPSGYAECSDCKHDAVRRWRARRKANAQSP